MELKAICFDIDNTLVHFNEAQFFEVFLSELYSYFKTYIGFDEFGNVFKRAVQHVSGNEGFVSNQELFLSLLASALGLPMAFCANLMELFYAKEYKDLKKYVSVDKPLVEYLHDLSESHLILVAASNPLLPLVAQRERLLWAGFHSEICKLITHSENFHFCKPNSKYYLKILDDLSLKADECLMIGDDPVNDMVAGRLGFRTFLYQSSSSDTLSVSNLWNGNWPTEVIKPDCSGSIVDLKSFLGELVQESA